MLHTYQAPYAYLRKNAVLTTADGYDMEVKAGLLVVKHNTWPAPVGVPITNVTGLAWAVPATSK